MRLPQSYDEKAILIADDEPEHIEWLADYLQARGYKVIVVTNVGDAIRAAESRKFRIYIIDLNIPLGDWIDAAGSKNSTYAGYQGLHIIQVIRTQGNNGRRVIAYSAHSNEQIIAEMKKLYCKYVIKGRAKELKNEISDSLDYDPKKGTQ